MECAALPRIPLYSRGILALAYCSSRPECPSRCYGALMSRSVRGGVARLVSLRCAVSDRPPGPERGAEVHGSHDPESVSQSVTVRGFARNERCGDLQRTCAEGEHVLHPAHHVARDDLHHLAGERDAAHAAAGAHDEVD